MAGNYLLPIFHQNSYLCIRQMRDWWQNIYDGLAKMPMAMVVAPFAMGIFVAERVDTPLWVLFLTLAVMLLGVLLSKGWQQIVFIVCMLAIAGSTLHHLSLDTEPQYDVPYDLELEVERHTVPHEKYSSTEVVITDCSLPSLVGRYLVVWGSTEQRFSEGDRLRLEAPIKAFREERRLYAEQMYHRGFIGSITLYPNSLYEFCATEKRTLHDVVVERLGSLLESGEERAVIMAMAVGHNEEISLSQRQQYSASGVSHLMAVSGLHVGIAFLLINLLLAPLAALHFGNIWRAVVAIILIWLYVVMCGTSPSAVRAAIMFSALQLSTISTREYVSENTLFATALVMLAFDTHLLFNLSFMLSVIAVAGILYWAMPIYRSLRSGVWLLNSVLISLLVGVMTTIATAPLVAHYFGIVSSVGIIITPIVLLFANIIIFASLMALVVPLNFVADIAEWAARVQNGIVAWASELPAGHLHISLSEGQVWGIYALFVVLTLIFSAKSVKKEDI